MKTTRKVFLKIAALAAVIAMAAAACKDGSSTGGSGATTYNLTVAVVSGQSQYGSVEIAKGKATGNAANAEVSVKATPASNDYYFIGWAERNDATANTPNLEHDNPLTFTIEKNTALYAVFGYLDPNKSYYTLTVSVKAGQETWGSAVITNGMPENNEANNNVTVTATANAGYMFDRWEDAAGTEKSRARAYEFPITANTALVAVFAEQDPNATYYSLDVYVLDMQRGWGTVDITAGSSSNVANTSVTVTATAAGMYSFTKWTAANNPGGETVSASAAYTFTITEDTTLYAVFGSPVESHLPADISGLKVYFADEETADWGVANAPDGAPAYFIENALNTEQGGNDGSKFYEIEFATAAPFDATGYDYIAFDMTADEWELLNSLSSEFYPRFRGGDEGSLVQFSAGNVLRAIIDRSNAAFTAGKWITLYIPISEKSGMNIHSQTPDESGTHASVMANTRIFMPRFRPSDAFIANPTQGKIYFRNFRLEKAVASALPEKILAFANNEAAVDYGITTAPGGESAYYFTSRLENNVWYNGLTFIMDKPFNATADGKNFFVFDMAADNWNALNAFTQAFPRIAGGGKWVQFNAATRLRAAIDESNRSPNTYTAGKWITVAVPVTATGGMVIHAGSDNDPADDQSKVDAVIAGEYATAMPAVANFTLRLSLGGNGSSVDAGSKLYLRNFRLESSSLSSLPSAIGSPASDNTSAVYGTDYGITTVNGQQAYFMSTGGLVNNGTEARVEMRFNLDPVLKADTANYFVFDVAVDSIEMLDAICSQMYPRLFAGSTWIQFNGTNPLRAPIFADLGISSPDDVLGETYEGQWFTVKLPISDADKVLHAGSTAPNDAGSQATDYAAVMPVVSAFNPRIILKGGFAADPFEGTVYFRNFRLE